MSACIGRSGPLGRAPVGRATFEGAVVESREVGPWDGPVARVSGRLAGGPAAPEEEEAETETDGDPEAALGRRVAGHAAAAAPRVACIPVAGAARAAGRRRAARAARRAGARAARRAGAARTAGRTGGACTAGATLAAR